MWEGEGEATSNNTLEEDVDMQNHSVGPNSEKGCVVLSEQVSTMRVAIQKTYFGPEIDPGFGPRVKLKRS